MNDDPKKMAGDKEYKAGYKTGRDADILTRAVEQFLGYTSRISTYGKGYQEGRNNRHKYGSRDSDKSKIRQSIATNEDKSKIAGSRSYYKKVESEPITYVFFTIPFISLIFGLFLVRLLGALSRLAPSIIMVLCFLASPCLYFCL